LATLPPASPANSDASEASRTKLRKWQRIFVNRSLNMGTIKAIGFDMDHTLVPYKREAFEALAFRETLKKFIEAGYPAELSELRFDPNFLIRGLLVDMDRGNLLKVDGHKYVKIAFHGKKRLTKDLRRKLYNKASYKAGEFLSVDTFFALSEVQLYAEIVDYMDRHPSKIQKSYREIYQDLRRFIDLSHADGSIKNEVLRTPERFVRRDKHLKTTLLHQLEAGKSLFLLTNSGWEYTDAIMTFALSEPDDAPPAEGAPAEFKHWRDYFEHVIVGAGKPGFFVGSQPFYEVMTDSGLLKMHSGPLQPGRVYHGGNANLFQKLTGVLGDEILFVGDHIYGDIVRSKETVNWRTMLIVEELDVELPKLDTLKDALATIRQRLGEREALDEEVQILRSRMVMNARQAERAKSRGEGKKALYIAKENEKILARAKEKDAELQAIDKDIKRLIEEREAAVHPVWGELMKVGLERSRFADQVAEYACVYTSSVTNLRFYSPFKRFASVHDVLPHDL
jgi:HAD superfamily 5'-nucleotidase-like hydrolase